MVSRCFSVSARVASRFDDSRPLWWWLVARWPAFHGLKSMKPVVQ